MSKLSQLSVGQEAVIASIDASSVAAVRLMEMGMTPGCSVKMIGSAPFGDPLEVEIRGYHLSLRKTEADLVELVS
ncbi:Ferrous iron transport protein A [Bremerella volcania]|uniref:Ferrous iron transport protein A n=1 Tax=Bremerella volcania TaxID=2527984 RepID=A0A518CBU9_9BACT|nr:ferrous iron transport protein A [Bremerella volcania]QDU76701.1 Ferrous iron transport protein A [Bremerella volcania]